MKTLIIALALSPILAHGATHSFDYAVGLDVPDDSILGVQNTHTLTDLGTLTSVQVSLSLTPVGPGGGWIGDLYAYLRHNDGSDTATSVLLNRIGRTADNSAGLSDGPAINITLAVDGFDIHNLTSPLGGALAGTFAADGRLVDPSLALNTDARTAGLAAFAGMQSEGDWTLFVADASGGNQYRLDSWSLLLETQIPDDPGNPQPVPETSSLALLGMIIGTIAILRGQNRASPNSSEASSR